MSSTIRPRRLRALLIALAGLGVAILCRPPAVRAADFSAKTSGNWSSSSTWTPAGVPGLNDAAYIGSTYPNGAAATATVLLTQNQQASLVWLGYGVGTSGTLDLGNFNLTANELELGEFNGGTGAITRGTGSLNIGSLGLWSSTLAMSANDRTVFLSLYNGSTATTKAVGNITLQVMVLSGSTLTLGADVNLYQAHPSGGGFHVYGDNSTLDAQGHRIDAGELTLGWHGGANVRLLNRGNLAVAWLRVANQNFNLTATDQVRSFQLSNGSTTFIPAATVGSLNLIGASTATTSATANITKEVFVQEGSTLTLGADLNVTHGVSVYHDNSTLDAKGHRITADGLGLGFAGGGGVNARLLNRGDLSLNYLSVFDQNFNLTATDQVTNFYLSNGSTTFIPTATVQTLSLTDGATATTSAAGNTRDSVFVYKGSTLTLGADLILSGNVVGRGHTLTIDAQGRNITAKSLGLTYAPDIPGEPNMRLLNDGAVTLSGAMTLAHVVQVELHDGNDTVHSLRLDNSGLRIKSAATGFTITGTTAEELFLSSDSTLTLELDGRQPGWVFRWANPAGGDHIADLNALIAQNLVVFSATNGGEFNIVSQNGYTYIVQPVPEPGLILLIAGPVALGLCRRRQNQRG